MSWFDQNAPPATWRPFGTRLGLIGGGMGLQTQPGGYPGVPVPGGGIGMPPRPLDPSGVPGVPNGKYVGPPQPPIPTTPPAPEPWNPWTPSPGGVPIYGDGGVVGIGMPPRPGDGGRSPDPIDWNPPPIQDIGTPKPPPVFPTPTPKMTYGDNPFVGTPKPLQPFQPPAPRHGSLWTTPDQGANSGGGLTTRGGIYGGSQGLGGAGQVLMQAPTGQMQHVNQAHVQHFMGRGAQIAG